MLPNLTCLNTNTTIGVKRFDWLGYDELETINKFDHEYKVPAKVTTARELEDMAGIIRKLCTRVPDNKQHLMELLSVMGEVLKSLNLTLSHNGGVLKETYRSIVRSSWPYDTFEAVYRAYVGNSLGSSYAITGYGPSEWAYQNGLTFRLREQFLENFLFTVASEPRRLLRVKKFNKLCDLLHWIVTVMKPLFQ